MRQLDKIESPQVAGSPVGLAQPFAMKNLELLRSRPVLRRVVTTSWDK